ACWFDHLQLINDALVEEEVSMYLLFALAYKQASTHCFFSLDSLDSAVYTTRPIYYGFKHFSRSIHRGWRRVSVTASNLKVSGFSNNSNDSMCVIIINTGSTATSATLKGIPEIVDTAEAYQTSKESGGSDKYGIIKKYEKVGSFTKSKISNLTVNLDPYSITTIDLWKKGPQVVINNNQFSKDKIAIVNVCKRNNYIFISFDKIPVDVKLSLFDLGGKKIKICDIRRAENVIILSEKRISLPNTYILKIETQKDRYILKQLIIP
ncbi:MAG: hypothetical protein N2053_11325, partial [Chitinispirillaceae bacterium]|nr:hypothetical protein [Chitinispirillaceae bacterium]